jgi:hypothetical protein
MSGEKKLFTESSKMRVRNGKMAVNNFGNRQSRNNAKASLAPNGRL